MPYDIIVGRNLADREKFGTRGTVFIGKSYVKMGEFVSLSNNILMDVARSHVVLVTGKRGMGKSYFLSVMAEEMANLPEEISRNLTILMLDTMGIFWTMKYPNTREQDLLETWGLKPKGMSINLYVPVGYFKEYREKGLPADMRFAIKTSELNASDWCDVFEIKITDPMGVLIEKSLGEVMERLGDDYEIKDIIEDIRKDKKISRSVKYAIENRFKNASKWGLFSKTGTEIKDILRRGEISVIDLGAYSQVSGGWSIKNLVVGILSKKLLSERIVSRKIEELENISGGGGIFIEREKELEKPMIWVFIDEAHDFLGREKDNSTSDALVQLLREGRQPGISLVLATQQPGVLKRDVLTQSDIVVAHRITAKVDIDALNSIMQSYLLNDIQVYMNNLPRLNGAAIILDDNSERIFPIGVRPKMSWHGGEAPSALKYQKKEDIEKVLGFRL